MNKQEFKAGTQVMYVPDHATAGDKDCEYGFITSVDETRAWVRFWLKEFPPRVRNLNNSECTPLSNLIQVDYVPQTIVDQLLPVFIQQAALMRESVLRCLNYEKGDNNGFIMYQ